MYCSLKWKNPLKYVANIIHWRPTNPLKDYGFEKSVIIILWWLLKFKLERIFFVTNKYRHHITNQVYGVEYLDLSNLIAAWVSEEAVVIVDGQGA